MKVWSWSEPTEKACAMSVSGSTIGGGWPPTPTEMAVATSVKSVSKCESYAAPMSPVSDS